MRAKFEEFNLTSTYKGDKMWNGNIYNSNNHLITIFNTKTKKRTSFEFWSSIMEPVIRKEEQLVYAFECFLTDALAYIQSRDIDDFAREFGYESVTGCIKAWNGCKNSAKKANRVIGDEERICDLINEINEEV